MTIHPVRICSAAVLAFLLPLGVSAQVTPVQPVRPVTTPRSTWGGTPAPVQRPSWAPPQATPRPPAAAPATAPAAPAEPPPAAAAPSAPTSGYAPSAYAPPAGDTPAELIAHPVWDTVTRRDYDGPKELAKCLELQKQTGTCILLYFCNDQDSSEKGLCHWWEKNLKSRREWQKATAPYLRVTIRLPGSTEARELATRYNIKTTPALLVLQPNDRPNPRFTRRVPVIKWSALKEPTPMTPAEALPALSDASTPAYQEYLAPIIEKTK